VKGVIKQLPAYGISILASCEVGEIAMDDGLATSGDGVVSLRVESELRALRVMAESMQLARALTLLLSRVGRCR
jgi:hypothetical protein